MSTSRKEEINRRKSFSRLGMMKAKKILIDDFEKILK